MHLIIALADHFEPAIVPEDGQKRAPRVEQERRLEWWAQEYPKVADNWRDHDGRPLVHTYFYPAEQYDEGLRRDAEPITATPAGEKSRSICTTVSRILILPITRGA